jgi:adenine-specific DNA-methyltransferase
MEPKSARQLTEKALSQAFDRSLFERLVKELFPELRPLDSVVKNGDLPVHFQDHIERIEMVGEYEDKNGSRIDILIIKLKKASKLQRARTMQRNIASWYLGRSSSEKHKDAAIAAYVPPEGDQWRFSFVKVQQTLKNTEAGVKTETEITPARRKSFPVGAHGNINTARKQIIQLLKKDAITLADLETAFDIEVVTKEFYQKVARLFVKLIGGTYSKGASTEEFPGILKLPSAKQGGKTMQQFGVRMIGRIIFCWFLREKKSKSSVSLVPESLLSLETLKETDDFYHGVLEPLFFEVLNTPIESRKKEYRENDFAKVPYLNGGLFRPQKDIDFYRPEKEQAVMQNTVKVPDEWLEELFDILELYNFTIDENTSVDVDLSVDPEMLGKIFENLLAYINPETEESARKADGSFYTPREIVDYMVDQSLIEHLKTKTDITEEKIQALISYDLADDEKYPLTNKEKDDVIQELRDITIFDPACGSGAFPIGALQKITFMLEQIDPEAKRWFAAQIEGADPVLKKQLVKENKDKNYTLMRKRTVIRNSIYGVDIQPIATEIARLRCFLTLIVEEDIDDEKPDRGVTPLPNLEFKFVTANTLIQPPKVVSSNGKDRQLEFESFEDELEEAVQNYFSASHQDKKHEYTNNLRDLIEEKSSEMTNRVLEDKGLIPGKKFEKAYREMNSPTQFSMVKEAELWKSYLNVFKNKPVDFFAIKYFFPHARDGFDIVIGNPPYIGEKGNREKFRPMKETPLGKEFYKGKMDYFYFFFHAGINYLKDGGVLGYITTNYYITADGAKTLREDFSERTDITKLINFNELKVFESALGQHNLITLLRKANDNPKVFSAITSRTGIATPDIRAKILFGEDEETEYFSMPQEKLFRGEDNLMRLAYEEIDVVLDKAQDRSTPLGDLCNVNQGIVSGANTFSNKHKNEFTDIDAEVGDGIFVLSELEAEAFSGNPHIKSWFKNSDIHKWSSEIKTDKRLILADKREPDLQSDLMIHLNNFRDLIDNVSSNSPYMHRPRDIAFEDPKIVFPQRSKKNTFAYNEIPWYAGSDVNFITSVKDKSLSIKYILGILNSNFIYKWLLHRGKLKGNMLELSVNPVENIPIPKNSSKSIKKEIIRVVNKILERKGSGKEIAELENEIDELVMDLYELTEEEKKIIRNS